VARWLRSIAAPFIPCSLVTIFSRSCSRNRFSLYWLVCIGTR
jgi:general stress protein CsbA